jgi:hypothetical protein
MSIPARPAPIKQRDRFKKTVLTQYCSRLVLNVDVHRFPELEIFGKISLKVEMEEFPHKQKNYLLRRPTE